MSVPRWVVLMLRWVAPPERIEDLVGDLEEAHRKRIARMGRVRADLLTSLETLDLVVALAWQHRLGRSRHQHRSHGAVEFRSRRPSLLSWIDIKLGVRMLFKYPGLTVIGGLGMAVAIAVGAGSFGFFYSYLYPTLGLEGEDRIVALENWDVAANNEDRRAAHDFVTWREEMETVGEMAAFRNIRRSLLVPDGPPQPISVAQMTASGFRIAGVPPFLGRFLRDDDEQPGAAPVIVLGYDEWQTRFAGDENVIGRKLRLSDTLRTVVGVMPPGYAFPMNHRFWVPFGVDLSAYAPGEGPAIFVFGRLRRGVTRDEAQAELTALGRRAAAASPETHAQLQPRVLPYTYPLIDIQDVSVWQVAVMQFLVSLVLIVVAVNVAVLTYARTATRRGEMAIRTALGANRWRIVGQLFVEALILSGGAALAGVALAKVGLTLAYDLMAEEVESAPFWMDYGLPASTVVYAVGLSVVAAVIVGILPAVQATGRGLKASLSQLAGATMKLGRIWTVLIVAQVSIAIIALPAAVATGWTEVFRFSATTPTFPRDEFVSTWLAVDQDLPPSADAGHATEGDAALLRVQHELMRRFEAEPYVSAVTFGQGFDGRGRRALVEIQDAGPPEGTASGQRVRTSGVAIGFFDAFEAPILTGRSFNAGDTGDHANTVIVNRTFVERILGDANALGRRVRYLVDGADPDTMPWYEVVGVVADLYTSEAAPELIDAVMYHALAPEKALGAVIAVRIPGGQTGGVRNRFQAIATGLDPSLRLNVVTYDELERQQQLAVRLTALIVGLVLLSVLLLSAAGIYALMSFTVTQRRREIGIRSALGAHRHRLLTSIFARAARQIGFGVGLGVAVAAILNWSSGGDFIGGVGTIVLPGVAGLMIVVGLIAAIGPARRGLRVEPSEALRAD